MTGAGIWIEVVFTPPRSKKRRIIKKCLKNPRHWTMLQRVTTEEEEREHDEFHRFHGDLPGVTP